MQKNICTVSHFVIRFQTINLSYLILQEKRIAKRLSPFMQLIPNHSTILHNMGHSPPSGGWKMELGLALGWQWYRSRLPWDDDRPGTKVCIRWSQSPRY